MEKPQCFPDDQEILFGRFEPYGAQFYRIRTDGSNLIRITTDDTTSHRHPRLSPDRQKIAFETRGRPNKIWVMNNDGSNWILLSTPESGAATPEWTPDVKRIVYRVYENEVGLWVINADGSNRKQLCYGHGIHHVSPVDGKIVFGTYQGIYTVRPDGSGLITQLVNSSCYGYPILWSRNGAKIAFRGDANGDHKEGICIINANGTGLREITGPALELEPTPCCAFDWIP